LLCSTAITVEHGLFRIGEVQGSGFRVQGSLEF
jgi:hypothetical protein